MGIFIQGRNFAVFWTNRNIFARHKKPVLILPVEFRRGIYILKSNKMYVREKIVEMKNFLIDAYLWDYTGQQAGQNDDSDDEEILEL